jgi:hypothetical protein
VSETIRCIDCKRECEPVNDSDMPVVRCVDCADSRASELVERLRPILGYEWSDAALLRSSPPEGPDAT